MVLVVLVVVLGGVSGAVGDGSGGSAGAGDVDFAVSIVSCAATFLLQPGPCIQTVLLP